MSMQSLFIRSLPAQVFLLVSLLFAGGCSHTSSGTSDMAVDRVVLYQSGVAYVERSGEVSGNEVTLRVRPDQINDILSSLVVIDLDGGPPATVSLPSGGSDEESPLTAVVDADSMEGMLRSVRGADVRVSHDGGRSRGRVLAVEDSPPRLSLLVDGRSAEFIALEEIEEVEFENEAVALRIRQSLDESMSSDDWQSVEVTLRFPPGQNERNLMVSWVVESPLWKPTYRVLLEDDERVVLQGWALVDNLSGEDWNDIELSLASGTPLSFRFDLHSPVHVERPDMSGHGVPRTEDLEPPSPMRARPAPEQRQRSSSGAGSGAGRGASGDDDAGIELDSSGPAAPEPEPTRQPETDDRIASGGQSADVREMDSLFRFDIPDRVTLPDRSSTMVTLVNTEVDGEDMLVYQPESGASNNHPFRSLLLQNTTDAPVQRSPVAIYRDGAFVGEGITPQIAPGERAVLPYALESRVHVDRRRSSRSGDVELLQIQNGQLQVEREQHQIWRFDVASSLDEDRELHVQVPRHDGHELQVGDDVDVREEEGFFLVPIELPAGEERTEEIAQMRETTQQIGVFNDQAHSLLVATLERPDLRPDVAEDLQEVVDAIEELNALSQQIEDDRSLRDDIRARIGEIRQNLGALGESEQHQELRNRLTERLEEQDDLLSEVAARIVENSEERSALRIEIEELMRDLSL